MVLLVAVLAVLIGQRFQRLSAPLEEVESVQGGVVSGEGERPIGVYTGFEYVERVAGELIFELLSKRTLGLSSGWHEIEGVRFQFYQKGEPGPILTCETASFNVQTRDARLAGRIRIDMPNGAVLTTDAGKFEASARRFTTNSPVDLVDGRAFGRAGSATYDLERDQITLDKRLRYTSENGTTMTAPRAVYHRQERRIDFPAGGIVQLDRSRLQAPRIELRLDGEDGPPQQIRLWGGVRARGTGLDDGASYEAWMEEVTATRDPRDRWQMSASTSGRWISVRFSGGTGYRERTLETMQLKGVLDREGLLNLRAEEGVRLYEVPTDSAPRSGESVSARVWFKDGSATDVELIENVVLRDEQVEGRAYRARLSPDAGLAMLHRDPTGPERVLLESERGRVSCDRAQLFNNEERAEARGNVQGEIRDVSIMGNDGEEEPGPVHFAAEILDVRRGGDEYHLQGNTRLWQGHRLLLADDVVYRHDVTSVRAAGHVRTTLPATALDAEADPAADVVVVARSLDYASEDGTAIYKGNVRYSDPEHTLAAAELRIFFDESDTISAVEAVGSVELVELESGRRMTGQKARREVESQIVAIEGSPVRLTDPAGNSVSGESLTWNQADGTVAVAGGTETIYYPEETPDS
jgi:lipopolysaccharide export system protein LptA